ncbi:hypothetical protein [Asanoa iriomotensis]|uniref:Uncharacterized protein n=1 Tax=Asanoa iriomotensis TaxID=234613 RepID=A0ABQ4C0E3_9ACTN|nr:hypothetical protein [Asanoa iriomotensis]GIF56263.1 hypothetical protein Air01nite_23580 [Asanoa iriomotensis]
MQPNPGATPRSHRAPIVVLSVVLFLLLGAIVVVQASRAGRRAADPCPVGEWDVVSYREVVELDDLRQTVTFGGGTGTVLRLRANGTGETDYGSGVTFTAEAPDGRPIRLEVAGPVRFRYSLATGGGSISVSPAGNDASSQLFINDAANGPRAGFVDPVGARSFRIECGGDSLTQDDGRLVVGYRRR